MPCVIFKSDVVIVFLKSRKLSMREYEFRATSFYNQKKTIVIICCSTKFSPSILLFSAVVLFSRGFALRLRISVECRLSEVFRNRYRIYYMTKAVTTVFMIHDMASFREFWITVIIPFTELAANPFPVVRLPDCISSVIYFCMTMGDSSSSSY